MSNAKRSSGTARRARGVWDASECALLLIDYQENVLDLVFEQDRRVVELNARTLATAARAFNIPVVLSTVGVEMGVNKPTISEDDERDDLRVVPRLEIASRGPGQENLRPVPRADGGLEESSRVSRAERRGRQGTRIRNRSE